MSCETSCNGNFLFFLFQEFRMLILGVAAATLHPCHPPMIGWSRDTRGSEYEKCVEILGESWHKDPSLPGLTLI